MYNLHMRCRIINKCNVIFSFSQQGSIDFRAVFHNSVLYVKLHNKLSRIFTYTNTKTTEKGGSRISYLLARL